MNYIVFDLEATCWRGHPPNGVNEIIEIGALRINEYGEELSVFSKFVKPSVNPLLSPFCKQLTSITQQQVDSARNFPYVIREFLEWGEIESSDDTYLISWGENDKGLFLTDCRIHKLENEWTEKHVNLKQHYKDLKRLPKAMSLRKAVENEGFEFTGVSHRGIDDAINLAKVFVKHIDEWAL